MIYYIIDTGYVYNGLPRFQIVHDNGNGFTTAAGVSVVAFTPNYSEAQQLLAQYRKDFP